MTPSTGARCKKKKTCNKTAITPSKPAYKDEPYKIVQLDRDRVRKMIEADMTIPQIAEQLNELTYEQVYDTILCDYEFNPLYRQHGQLKAKKGKR